MVNYYAEYIDSVITAVNTQNIECEVAQTLNTDELEEPELKQIIKEIDALETLEELTDIQYIDKEQILNNEIIVKDSVEFIDSMYDFDNIDYLDNDEEEIIEEIIVPKQFDVDLSIYEEQIHEIMQFNETLEEKAQEFEEEHQKIEQEQEQEQEKETNNEADLLDEDLLDEDLIDENLLEENEENTTNNSEEINIEEESFFNTEDIDEVIEFKPRIKPDTEMNLNEELDLFSDENTDENSDYTQEKDPFDFEETAFSVEENKIDELEQSHLEEFKNTLTDAVKETLGITEEPVSTPIKFDSPNVSKFDEYVYNSIINFHNKLFRIPKSFKNIFSVA